MEASQSTLAATGYEEELAELKLRFPEARSGELLGYLHIRSGSIDEAASQYKSSRAWRFSFPVPTILDCAPFLRIPEGSEGPDGCIVCLEDMRGDCARDKRGRPIVASIGMLHGTANEMQKQMTYAMNRALLYAAEGELEGQCSVVEVVPRAGANPTFRFPDAAVRTVLDVQRHHFPGSAVASTTHFCGLPRAVTWGFALCKPFMAKETYENMLLMPDFSHLPDHIDDSSILREWGGSLKFDLEEYIAWRAREEGVDVRDILPKRYDASVAAPAGDGASEENPLAGVSSQSLKDVASKMATVSKRGSGIGMFASYKWKDKLCACSAGCLLYFSSSEVSETNTVDKLIPLQGSYVEEVTDVSGPTEDHRVFCVVTPARSYHFAVVEEEELQSWIGTIANEAQAVAG